MDPIENGFIKAIEKIILCSSVSLGSKRQEFFQNGDKGVEVINQTKHTGYLNTKQL